MGVPIISMAAANSVSKGATQLFARRVPAAPCAVCVSTA